MLTVAILAGGLAKRLRPLTETIPKALLDISGKPFICSQLAYLRTQGVQRVVLCVGYLGNMIQDIVGNGAAFGLDVVYSFDGPELLGTGGALKQALPLLGEQFFVLYGDSFLPINFLDIEGAFVKSNKPALMTVYKNEGYGDASNVLFQEGELIEYNKSSPKATMNFIDYGLSVLSQQALSKYPSQTPFDLAEVYHQLSVRSQLAGHEVYQRFYEIGSLAGLKETERYFMENKLCFEQAQYDPV